MKWVLKKPQKTKLASFVYVQYTLWSGIQLNDWVSLVIPFFKATEL